MDSEHVTCYDLSKSIARYYLKPYPIKLSSGSELFLNDIYSYSRFNKSLDSISHGYTDIDYISLKQTSLSVHWCLSCEPVVDEGPLANLDLLSVPNGRLSALMSSALRCTSA